MTGPDQTSATGIDTWTSYTEYGQPQQTTTTTPGGTTGIGYGWLGTKQRATLETGLTLMGFRLYNQVSGNFTSTDAVYGGNPTAYDYPPDPVNSSDITGLANGCGGADISRLVPDRFYLANFNGACNRHDDCYSPQSRANRSTCDYRFYIDLCRACGRAYWWSVYMSSRCLNRARTYYLAVRFGARGYYRGKGDPR